MDEVDASLLVQLQSLANDVDKLTIKQAREKIKTYKSNYFKILKEKIDKYNLLLLEYAMYIPNERLISQLAIDRIPLLDTHLNGFSKFRFNRL
jgi:hypothetical protein